MAQTPRTPRTPRKKSKGTPRMGPQAAADLRAILDQFDVHNSSVGVVHGQQRFTYVPNSDADALSFANSVSKGATQLDAPLEDLASSIPQQLTTFQDIPSPDYSQPYSLENAGCQVEMAFQHANGQEFIAQHSPEHEQQPAWLQNSYGAAPQPIDIPGDAPAMSHNVPDIYPVGGGSIDGGYASQEQDGGWPAQEKEAASTFVGLQNFGDANSFNPLGESKDFEATRGMDRKALLLAGALLVLTLGFFAWIIVPSIWIARRDTVRKTWLQQRCLVLDQRCAWKSTDALGNQCLGDSYGEEASGEGWLLTPNCRWVDPAVYSVQDGGVTVEERAADAAVAARLVAHSDGRRSRVKEADAVRVEGGDGIGVEGEDSTLRYTACHTQYTITLELAHPKSGEVVVLDEVCRDTEASVKPMFNAASDFCQDYRDGVKCDAEALENADSKCLVRELSLIGTSMRCWIDPGDSETVTVEGSRSVQAEMVALISLVAVLGALLCCACSTQLYIKLKNR